MRYQNKTTTVLNEDYTWTGSPADRTPLNKRLACVGYEDENKVHGVPTAFSCDRTTYGDQIVTRAKQM